MKRPSRQYGPRRTASDLAGAFAAVALCLLAPVPIRAEPLSSPTWGFSIDLPAGYALIDGDGQRRFSFAAESGDRVDLVAYPAGRFATVDDVGRYAADSLRAESESGDFLYRGKRALLLSLSFQAEGAPVEGWALCLELARPPAASLGPAAGQPFLLALAYGRGGDAGLDAVRRSALDSLAPTTADRGSVGPLSAFAYPPTKRKAVRVAGLAVQATIDESDLEASRSLVDREFSVLSRYEDSPLWKEAWTRFYRAIYRDSYDRLADIALTVERALSEGEQEAARPFAERALAWIQGFAYERDLMGSDFVDLVTAATEGRGDCDSRSLLLAVILMRSGIEAGIMVSREYSHAMALVDAAGGGARFDFGGKKWVVAETTAKIPLGLIGKDKADPAKWLGILLD